MELRCDTGVAKGYKSGSQIARRITEDWCAKELYCPACHSDCLEPSPANTPAVDFRCPLCAQTYQLKGTKNGSLDRIVDAAYNSMMRAIRSDSAPHLFVLQYTPNWLIRNLLLVPRFFLTQSTIEKRPPLHTSARRAGWVGCNIVLTKIPEDGKINIVQAGAALPKHDVRLRFSAIAGLRELEPELRGWTVDVLRIIRDRQGDEFTLGDLYSHEAELSRLHPRNNNVRPKIRQQLQVLRDLGFLIFRGSGKYKLRSHPR